MLIEVPNILDAAQVAYFRKRLDEADWVDGNVTSGHQAAKAKNNLQVPEESPIAKELGDIILKSLGRSALFMSAALPFRIFPPLFNCYRGGQSFGTHVDGAIRPLTGTGHRIRTDMSMTLFLSEPEEYDGGELTIQEHFGPKSVKLKAGNLVLYPSSSLHKVTPVTRGARISSFFWLQSMVRDDDIRTELFNMDVAIQKLTRDVPEHSGIVELTGIYNNLIRRYAEI